MKGETEFDPKSFEISDYDIGAGRVAYSAYSERLAAKAVATGEPIPEFDDLPRAIREAWIVAAIAVKRRFGAIH